MNKRGLWLGRYALFLLILGLAFLVFKYNSPITGGIIGLQNDLNEKIWNFADPTEYEYDPSIINLSGSEAKLIPTITIKEWMTEEVSLLTITVATLQNSGGPQDKTAEVQAQDGSFATLNKRSAMGGPRDKTAEVQAQDGSFATLNKRSAILDINFGTALNNGDIISLYLLSSNVDTNIYLCNSNTSCTAPGYGQIQFNGKEGWYNLTLSGLSSSKSVFGIDPPKNVKVDYAVAYHKQVIPHTTTNITYPTSGELQTKELAPANFQEWRLFSKEEIKNSQSLEYYYSTDSGNSWVQVPVDGDLSSVSSNKLRFKAKLISDGITSPALKNMKLQYFTQIPCVEQWSCSSWNPVECPVNETQIRICTDANNCGTKNNKPAETQSCTYVPPCLENWTLTWGECTSHDQQLKYYSDSNLCGTKNNLPMDNGTSVSCDYCLPLWTEVNSSCQTGNTFTSNYFDSNNCFALTGLESDHNIPNTTIQDCNYCAFYNCTNSANISWLPQENTTTWNVDAINKTKVKLELTAGGSTNPSCSIIEYSYNIKNNTPALTSANRYVDISSSLENISAVKIFIYYTDEEITAANLDENSLKIHYYNESSQQWQELNSTVDTSNNYVSASVPHLSLYGLFGEPKKTAESSSSPTYSSGSSGSSGSSSSGGSSSGGSSTSLGKEILSQEASSSTKTRPTALSSNNGPAAEKKCDYTLEISLTDEISFLEEDQFQGEIINKGDCDLSQLNLELSPEISEIIGLMVSSLNNLQVGNKTTFTLIRREQKQSYVFGYLRGSSIANSLLTKITPSKQVEGKVTVEGIDGEQTVFKEELPVTIKVEKIPPLRDSLLVSITGTFCLSILIVVILVIKRKKERELERKKKKKY